MHLRSCDEHRSVRLSVKRVNCDKTPMTQFDRSFIISYFYFILTRACLLLFILIAEGRRSITSCTNVLHCCLSLVNSEHSATVLFDQPFTLRSSTSSRDIRDTAPLRACPLLHTSVFHFFKQTYMAWLLMEQQLAF